MINIYEILKNCPTGIKLYQTMWGETTFTGVNDGKIILDSCSLLDAFGRWNKHGECVLFPSKEQRDWSKFKVPQPLPVKDELCWTKTSVGNWVPRYATGDINDAGKPIFYAYQNKNSKYLLIISDWNKWCDFEELVKNK